jgi:hypothetical protein
VWHMAYFFKASNMLFLSQCFLLLMNVGALFALIAVRARAHKSLA